MAGVEAFAVQHVILLTRRAVDVVAGLLIVFTTYVFMAFCLNCRYVAAPRREGVVAADPRRRSASIGA